MKKRHTSQVHVYPTSYRGDADWLSSDYDTVQESLDELEERVLAASLRPLHLDFRAPYPSSLPPHFRNVIDMVEMLASSPVHIHLPGEKAYALRTLLPRCA